MTPGDEAAPAADMLLIGAQAMALRHPELAAPASHWDVWVARRAARDINAGLRFERDAVSGDAVAFIDEGARRYRFTLIGDDDARALFMAADAGEPKLPDAGERAITIASSSSLALIERALLYRDEHWHPRAAAYHRLRALVPAADAGAARRAAFDALRAQVLAVVDAKRFDMRVSNEAFFGTYRNAWLRWYPHDQLHRATCYGAVPLYEKLKDDPSLAFVPRAGFDALSPPDRLRLVREECYALALERVLIPAEQLGIAFAEPLALQTVLRRLCTDLARGWFRDFAIEHYPAIIDYDTPFWQRFCQARQRGELTADAALVGLPGRDDLLRAYWNDERERDRQAGLPQA